MYLYRGRSYRTDTSSLKIHSWKYTGSNCRDTQLQSTTDSQHSSACIGTSFASAFRNLTQDYLFLKREALTFTVKAPLFSSNIYNLSVFLLSPPVLNPEEFPVTDSIHSDKITLLKNLKRKEMKFPIQLIQKICICTYAFILQLSISFSVNL